MKRKLANTESDTIHECEIGLPPQGEARLRERQNAFAFVCRRSRAPFALFALAIIVTILTISLSEYSERARPVLDDWFPTVALYYAWQRPLILKRAEQFGVHWCWTADYNWSSAELLPSSEPMDLMLRQRLRGLAAKAQEFNRTDAWVEKDKCKMVKFFEQNRLPHLRSLGMWTSMSDLIRGIESGNIFANVTEWPVFFKACHAGSIEVLSVKSLKWAQEHAGVLLDFVKDKFVHRFHDTSRLWNEELEPLLQNIPPGVYLSSPAHVSYHDEDEKMRIFETKVHTLYGRAYTAELYADNQAVWSGRRVQFIRGEHEQDFDYHDPGGLRGILYMHRLLEAMPFPSWKWILHERHIPCVWALAERVAQILAADQVRVDVFITRGRPYDCTLNEISLSFGNIDGQAATHWRFEGLIWRETVLTKNIRYVGGVDSSSSYNFRAGDLPTLAHATASQPMLHAFLYADLDENLTAVNANFCKLMASVEAFATRTPVSVITDRNSRRPTPYWHHWPWAWGNWFDKKYKKFRALLYTLERTSLKDDDVVLYLDASSYIQLMLTDSFAKLGPTFEALDLPKETVLFMAERHCADCGHMTLGPIGRPRCNCTQSFSYSSSSYRYLNARIFVGRKRAVHAMLRSWVCYPGHNLRNRDRNCAQELYLSHHRDFEIRLDHRCDLFQSAFGTALDGDSAHHAPFLSVDREGWLDIGPLRNPETGTHPAVVLLKDQDFAVSDFDAQARRILGKDIDFPSKCTAKDLATIS